MNRWLSLLPLALFILLAVFLARSFTLEQADKLPSALLGQHLPNLTMPTLSEDKVNVRLMVKEVALLNVWATWCPTCLAEHRYLLEISKKHALPIYGVNYKDDPDKARSWLAELGNPYVLNLQDDGSLGIELGVYGAPETFVIDAQGVIRYRHVGEVNERVWSKRLYPLIMALRKELPQ